MTWLEMLLLAVLFVLTAPIWFPLAVYLGAMLFAVSLLLGGAFVALLAVAAMIVAFPFVLLARACGLRRRRSK